MDTIRFIRKQAAEGFDVIGIEINGVSLVELARVHEQQFADAEGHPNIAGGYEGMTPSDLLSGDDGLSSIESSRIVQVLQCDGCLEPGCWPLRCRVEMQPDRVIWSDFEQPYRDSGDQRWTYDGFGPFVFSRAEYDAALASIPPRRAPQ